MNGFSNRSKRLARGISKLVSGIQLETLAMPSESDGPIFTFQLLGYCIAAFTVMLLVHVAVWRVLKTRKQIAWLFAIFLVSPTLVYLGGMSLGSSRVSTTIIYLFVITLSATYVVSYPVVQTESPTVVMVRLLDKHNGCGGLTRAEILAAMRSETVFEDRIRDLRNNGLVGAADDAVAPGLSGFGRAVAAFFYYYRRALKLPLGEG